MWSQCCWEGHLSVVGSIWVAEVARLPPQEVLTPDFLCHCSLHCTQIVVFTWAILLSGPEEKRRAVQFPTEFPFLDPVCVLPPSATLGKGRERMLLHSLEPEKKVLGLFSF